MDMRIRYIEVRHAERCEDRHCGGRWSLEHVTRDYAVSLRAFHVLLGLLR